MATGKIEQPFLVRYIEAPEHTVNSGATNQCHITCPSISGYKLVGLISYNANTGSAQNYLIMYTWSVSSDGLAITLGYRNTGSSQAKVTPKINVLYQKD